MNRLDKIRKTDDLAPYMQDGRNAYRHITLRDRIPSTGEKTPIFLTEPYSMPVPNGSTREETWERIRHQTGMPIERLEYSNERAIWNGSASHMVDYFLDDTGKVWRIERRWVDKPEPKYFDYRLDTYALDEPFPVTVIPTPKSGGVRVKTREDYLGGMDSAAGRIMSNEWHDYFAGRSHGARKITPDEKMPYFEMIAAQLIGFGDAATESGDAETAAKAYKMAGDAMSAGKRPKEAKAKSLNISEV
ncbi:MAG: hypothetical protein QMD97_01915 [Candidatus Aenigmarchaeota archaeon]|nr:hypothetical protein [Candidatus Aenigmarchaeota archaeon]